MEKGELGRCWHCGAALGARDYGRETNCLSCGRPTRVCRNCRWFSRGAPNQCREPSAEPVLEKERANYCEFFEPSPDAGAGVSSKPDDDLMKKAEDLFKF